MHRPRLPLLLCLLCLLGCKQTEELLPYIDTRVGTAASTMQTAGRFGNPYPHTYLHHADILQGGVLRFVMGDNPKR